MSAPPEDDSWKDFLNPDYDYEERVPPEDEQPPEEIAVPPAIPGSPATNLEPHPPMTETPGPQATTSAPTPGASTGVLDIQPLSAVSQLIDFPEETPSTGANTAKKRGRPPGSTKMRGDATPPNYEESEDDDFEYPPTGMVNFAYDFTLSLPAEVKKGKWDKLRAKKALRQNATWPEPRPRPASEEADAPPPSSEAWASEHPDAPPPSSEALASEQPDAPPPSSEALASEQPDAPPPSSEALASGVPFSFFPTATSPPPTDVAGLSSPPPPVAATTLPRTDVAGPSSMPPPAAATTLPPTGENSTQQRRRGRPPKRLTEEPSGQAPAEAGLLPTGAGEGKFITVEEGQDIYAKLLSFAQKVGRKVTVLCAVGMVTLVTMKPIDGRDPERDFPGEFDILYLHGRLTTMAKDSSQVVVSPELKIQFAAPKDGVLKTGTVIGPVIALSPVEITLMVDKPPEIRPEKKPRKQKKDGPESPSEQKGKKQKKDPDMGGGSFNAVSLAGIAV